MSPYRDEVVELLRALLRLDTVNPPGNETQAAELLRDHLARSGVEVRLVAKAPEHVVQAERDKLDQLRRELDELT